MTKRGLVASLCLIGVPVPELRHRCHPLFGDPSFHTVTGLLALVIETWSQFGNKPDWFILTQQILAAQTTFLGLTNSTCYDCWIAINIRVRNLRIPSIQTEA